MILFRSFAVACALSAPAVASSAVAQTANNPLVAKLNPYIECTNRHSARIFDSRARYESWVGRSAPTGKERNIYGVYTIYDTADCRAAITKANTLEPRDPEWEAAATAYGDAIGALEPLLKEANDYYDQQNYKDDKMAKGRAMHPRLIAAFDVFAKADTALRMRTELASDKVTTAKIADIEASEGKKVRWHVENLMLSAKRLHRIQVQDKPDLAAVQTALASYETLVSDTEKAIEADPKKPGSSLLSASKSYLVTAKQLMRRVRDKVPYSQGERMLMNTGGGSWMVEGSPARLTRDYNQLVDAYNRGLRF
jgi:hypothetical protein